MRAPGRSFWIAQVAGWAAYALILWLSTLPASGGGLTAILPSLRMKISMGIAGFAVSTLLGLLFLSLLPRKPGITALAATAVGASILMAPVLALTVRAVFGARPVLSREVFHGTSNYAITLVAWSALFLTISTRKELEAERERTLRATALASEAQLQMLRYQVNPHFLFNALNSIRALIDENPARAREMVTELSEFFRYSLLNAKGGAAPLGEELDAIRNYLAIQKIRFEERLEVSFDVEAAARDTRLPGFLVHPLVENAVKHGMETSAMPLRVAVSATRSGRALRIEVANTGRLAAPGERSASLGTGTGLANVRERLRQLFPARHRFEMAERDGWVRALVELDLDETPA